MKVTLDSLRIASQSTGVCLVAYLAGYHFTWTLQGKPSLIGALWAVISGIVVLQATWEETWSAAALRVLGSLLGALISIAYLYLLPFSVWGLAASIGITVWLCQVLRIPGHGRLAAITVAVIMVVSQLEPGINPLINATLRFLESCIGTVLALLAALAWPQRKPSG